MTMYVTAMLQYPYLFQPRKPFAAGGTPAYSACLIMEESEARKAWDAIQKVMVEAFDDRQVPTVFRSGQEKLNPKSGFRTDNFFMNVTSQKAPEVYNLEQRLILGEADPDARLFYPGAWVRAVVRFWAQGPRDRRGYPDRVNAELKGVLFLGHSGVVLEGGAAPINISDFGPLPSAAGEDPSVGHVPQPIQSISWSTSTPPAAVATAPQPTSSASAPMPVGTPSGSRKGAPPPMPGRSS